MILFTILEVFYLVLTTFVVGYIFSGMIRKEHTDPLTSYKRFDWKEIWFSIQVAAPGIILHELGHKFVAIAFGLDAHYEIWPTGLLLGIILKMVGSGFMLLAPGYVTIIGASPLIASLTAFAGPFVNLCLWIIPLLIVKYHKNLRRTTALTLLLMQNINKWLFLFNMIPIPPLDGFKVIQPLLSVFF